MDIAGQSFLGRSDLPRGLRNNNPMNLVKTSIPWLGKIQSSDARFEQFRSLGYGIRAGILDLINDYQEDNARNLIDLISQFAPPHENDTSAYISYVARNTGLLPNQEFSQDKIPFIAYYMAILENGPDYSGFFNVNDFVSIYNALANKRGAPQAKPVKNLAPVLLGIGLFLLN